MADSIVRNSDPAVPIADLDLVTEPDFGHEVEHLLHPQLVGSGHVIVWRPVKLRAGTIVLTFPTLAAANAAIDLLATAYNFTWTADEPAASLTFVVAPGRLKPRPAAAGSDAWVLDVPFQEV